MGRDPEEGKKKMGQRGVDQTYANIVVSTRSCKPSFAVWLKVSTINRLVVFVPVNGEWNCLHLVSFALKVVWELVGEQEIFVDDVGGEDNETKVGVNKRASRRAPIPLL